MKDATVDSAVELARSILGSVGAATELLYEASATTGEERARKAWTIYSVVMLLDFADSAATCYEANLARAMAVLARSVYEFYITAAYFQRHPELALQQLQSVQGRQLLRASNGPFQREDERRNVVEQYQKWLEEAQANGLDAYAGNKRFREMALEMEGETPEKCPTYSTRYGLPSIYAHPDGAGVPDVLTFDGNTINVAWKSTRLDKNLQMLLINDILLAVARMLREQYNCFMSDYESLHERQAALQVATLKEKGFRAE